jgi:lipoteichoic acid synthase
MRLPLALAVFFALSSQAFNYWLGIVPSPFNFQFFWTPLATGLLVFGVPNMLLTKRAGCFAYNLAAVAMVAAAMVAQFLYYRYSGGFLQASAIHFVGSAFSVKSAAEALFDPVLVFFLLGVAAVLADFWLRKNAAKISLSARLTAVAAIVLTVVGSWWGLIAAETKARGNADHLYKVAYDSTDLTKRIGIINYTLLDAFKYATRPKGVTEQEVEFVRNWAAKRPPSGEAKAYRGLAAGRNVIVVQVESLEAFTLNLSLEGQQITPSLNRLSKDGLALTNHHYHTLYAPTANNEFSILNSLHPLADGVPFMEYPANKYYALPEHLKTQGYYTAALEGDVATFWNRSNAYPAMGFDKFHDIKDFSIKRKVGWGLADNDMFEQSIEKLAGMSQPFFVKLATLSSHVPFAIPDDMKTLALPDGYKGLSPMQLDYLQAISYVDKSIGDFIERLKAAGLYDNSLIIITGDHGAGAQMHNQSLKKLLGAPEDEIAKIELERVPLIILAPGTELKGSIATPSSHIDLYPTISNLLGLNTPKTVLGQDILNPVQPAAAKRLSPHRIESIWSERLIFVSSGGPGSGSCYDAASRQKVAFKECHELYQRFSDEVRASDIIIKGNLLPLLQ